MAPPGGGGGGGGPPPPNPGIGGGGGGPPPPNPGIGGGGGGGGPGMLVLDCAADDVQNRVTGVTSTRMLDVSNSSWYFLRLKLNDP